MAVYQMMGCPWKNRDQWFPDNHDETKNQKPKKDITNYFTPTKEKTNDKGTKKETKKETNSSAMVIDDEDNIKIEQTDKKVKTKPNQLRILKSLKIPRNLSKQPT